MRGSPTLLSRFLELEEASDAEVFAFAQRWGPLGLCEAHGLPSAHWKDLNRPGCPVQVFATREVAAPRRGLGVVPPTILFEPIEGWRRLAAEAAAMLRIAARVNQGKPGTPEDWQIVQSYPQEGSISDRELFEGAEERRVAWWRARLATEVGRWLEWGEVRPRIRWDGPQPALVLCSVADSGTIGSLFAALAVGLAEAVCDAGVVRCGACGRAYKPKPGHPRAGQQNYCQRPECRKAATRDRKRRSRARRRAGRRRAARKA